MIETTRCTQAQAELVLYDQDNDLAKAIDFILENASEVESWTEHKSKKDKKKEEEEHRERGRRPMGQVSSRGRASFGDRGGRGRGAFASRVGIREQTGTTPNIGLFLQYNQFYTIFLKINKELMLII